MAKKKAETSEVEAPAPERVSSFVNRATAAVKAALRSEDAEPTGTACIVCGNATKVGEACAVDGHVA